MSTVKGLPPSLPQVVDIAAVRFSAQGWLAYLRALGEQAPGYLRVFGPRLCRQAGADEDAYFRALARSAGAAAEILVEAGGLAVDFGQHARDLRAAGVRCQVLLGLLLGIGDGDRTINDELSDIAKAHPETFKFFVGARLDDVDRSVAEIERGVNSLGAAGVTIVPFWDGVSPVHQDVQKIFATAQSMGLPVWIHTGHSLAANRPIDMSTWRELDALARTYPDLTLIAGHGGWPWLAEMVALCQRHPNVYLDTSAHRPAHIGLAGSGWEPVLLHGRTTIRDKVLFGSSEWATGKTTQELADELIALELGETTTRAWLHDNAARLLGLEDAS